MIEVTFYTREGCHLCEQTLEKLAALQAEYPHHLSLIDIDENPEFIEPYADAVPVIEIGNYILKAPITIEELTIALSVAKRNIQNKTKSTSTIEIKPSRKVNLSVVRLPAAAWSKADSFSYWLARHYLAMINLFLIVFLGFPLLAPVFMNLGWTLPATMIYRIYSVTCHQLAYRSFFLFGDQYVYPREAAGVENLATYSQATQLGEGNNPQDVLGARNFIGDEKIGYKIAICQRDVAIYSGILIFNFIFALTRRKLNPLHWLVWVLLAIVPVGVDGISQLVSQPPLSLLPFRESTPLLRMMTGFLFGFTTAWFGIPHIEISMRETREMYEYKLQQIESSQMDQHAI